MECGVGRGSNCREALRKFHSGDGAASEQRLFATRTDTVMGWSSPGEHGLRETIMLVPKGLMTGGNLKSPLGESSEQCIPRVVTGGDREHCRGRNNMAQDT